ncbi:MAG: TetR/AcrR family transcriptional regulator [Bacteriovoracaceae bacterium]|nr:TetR/AcrR family transcriptional regulator [Bacteriovoracaceae bacterium]
MDFTLREIATALKVSHTAIYRHFKSKQDLLSYIAEEGFHNLCHQFEFELEKVRSSRMKFKSLIRTYIHFALLNSGHYRSMFHHELRCENSLRPELEIAGMNAFNHLMEIYQSGVKEPVFRKDKPEIMARSIWSSIHGFQITSQLYRKNSLKIAHSPDINYLAI